MMSFSSILSQIISQNSRSSVIAAPGTPVVCTVKGDYVNPRKFARGWADRAASLGLHGVSLRDVRRDHAILAQSREAEAGR